MRSICLIRHGEPAFPEGKRVCLGRSDLPLSVQGRLQAALSAYFLSSFPSGRLFSSPLLRARETAAFIGEATVCEELTELDMGAWEGLAFSEIREKWPKVYRKRGTDPYYTLIPGAEAPGDCTQRMLRCLDALLGKTDGDITIVSHAGAIRSLLCGLHVIQEKDFLTQPLPYGGITLFTFSNGVFTPVYIGKTPRPTLTRDICLRLLRAAGTPENIVRHSLAVERQALHLAEGRPVNRELLSCAALLHDIARTAPFHERAGADRIEALGYSDAAAIIRVHTDLPEQEANTISESSLLFLADKTVSGDMPVPLEVRFGTALKKCTTPEAIEAHTRRYAQAAHILSLLKE